MHERAVTIPAGVGLHARPASRFVDAATRAPVEVTIAKDGADPTAAVSARSILSVLGLDVRGGDRVVLRADGPGDALVVDELAAVLEAGDADA
jgi:phosphocarrier protein HPr